MQDQPLRFRDTPILLETSSPISVRRTATTTGSITKWDVIPEEDFTIYVRASLFERALRRSLEPGFPVRQIETSKHFDFSHPVQLRLSKDAADYGTFQGRVHAVRCSEGAAVSVTLRSLKFLKGSSAVPAPSTPFQRPLLHELKAGKYDVQAARWAVGPVRHGAITFEIEKPPGEKMKFWNPGAQGRQYLAPVQHSSRAATSLILPGMEEATPFEKVSGLVLITGETGCGKTLFLNGVLAQFLRKILAQPLAERPRRPHILAIGDPVETRVYSAVGLPTRHDSADFQDELGWNRPIDFTDRAIGRDTPSVGEALIDALRETPAAVVVSELRKEDDFRAALDFAATGHLIFATAHNTSLIDAMSKLMRVSRAKTPSDRANLAQRLRAVVHLSAQTASLETKAGNQVSIQVNVPLVWRANSSAIRNFVAEGLSSLYPRTPADGIVPAVVERAVFVTLLEKYHDAWDPLHPGWQSHFDENSNPFKHFRSAMRRLDLHA